MTRWVGYAVLVVVASLVGAPDAAAQQWVPPSAVYEFASHRLSFGEGPLFYVVSLDVSRDGRFITVDDYQQIRRYASDGQLISRLYQVPRWHPSGPNAVSLLDDGNDGVYVLDTAFGTLTHVAGDGTVLQAVGGEGSQPGQFELPANLAQAPDGTIYVADFGNNRVQRFSHDLGLLESWLTLPLPTGAEGPAGPDALAVDRTGRIWVAWNYYGSSLSPEGRPLVEGKRLLIYEPGGTLLANWPIDVTGLNVKDGSQWLFRDMAIDSEGRCRLFLDQDSPTQLLTLDEAGNRVGTIMLPNWTKAVALATDDSIIVATSQGPQEVQLLAADGETQARWGGWDWAVERQMIVRPRRAAFDLQHRVLVSGGVWDSDPSAAFRYVYLHRYLSDGSLDAILDSSTHADTPDWNFALRADGTLLRSANSVAADREGYTYELTIDWGVVGHITKTSPSGVQVAQWDVDWHVRPILVGGDNRLYLIRGVAVSGFGVPLLSVERYTLDFSFLGSFEVGGWDVCAVDPAGYVYVFDKDYWGLVDIGMVHLARYSPNGAQVGYVRGPQNDSFQWIGGAAVAEDGSLAVADSRGRVHLYQMKPSQFADIPLWFWAKPSIELLSASNVVAGYPGGTFRPSEPITRAQLAVLLARAMAGGDENVPLGPSRPTFDDVPRSYWAYNHIEYCASHGVIKGTARGFLPEALVNRGQIAVFVARAAAGGDENVPDVTTFPDPFPDVTQKNAWSWCWKYAWYLRQRHIIGGYDDGLYHPELFCTRDQMAAIVAPALDWIGPAPIRSSASLTATDLAAPTRIEGRRVVQPTRPERAQVP